MISLFSSYCEGIRFFQVQWDETFDGQMTMNKHMLVMSNVPWPLSVVWTERLTLIVIVTTPRDSPMSSGPPQAVSISKPYTANTGAVQSYVFEEQCGCQGSAHSAFPVFFWYTRWISEAHWSRNINRARSLSTTILVPWCKTILHVSEQVVFTIDSCNCEHLPLCTRSP